MQGFNIILKNASLRYQVQCHTVFVWVFPSRIPNIFWGSLTNHLRRQLKTETNKKNQEKQQQKTLKSLKRRSFLLVLIRIEKIPLTQEKGYHVRREVLCFFKAKTWATAWCCLFLHIIHRDSWRMRMAYYFHIDAIQAKFCVFQVMLGIFHWGIILQMYFNQIFSFSHCSHITWNQLWAIHASNLTYQQKY